MISFPNCKINIGLQVLDKRPDGYHNIQSIFYPFPFKDALEIVEGGSETRLNVTGLPIPADDSNLCLKAYHVLKKDFPGICNLQMHLHKVIPAGAGLGGGSSNGAFALQLINRQFNLNLDQGKLLEYALQLGSDCPFFILNKPCMVTGRGEELQEINLSLSGYTIVLINTNKHINTAFAYSKILERHLATDLNSFISRPIPQWKDSVINDFEVPVFKIFPELEEIKKMLYHQGAIYASMSGSGGAFFGIFDKDDPDDLFTKSGYLFKKIRI